MKHFKHILLTVMFVLVSCFSSFADETIYYNGITYSIDSDIYNTVKVNRVSDYLLEEQNGEITIPASFYYKDKTYTVVAIERYAFNWNSKLKKVTLPSTVKIIEESAFCNCSNLESINLEGVQTIKYTAFCECTNLESINLEGIQSIGDNAFSKCSSLESVTFGSGITTIDVQAFFKCEKISSVRIPDLATWCNIDFYSGYSNPCQADYRECKTSLYIGESTKPLTELVIPSDMTEVKKYTFYNTAIESVTFPSSVTSIGERAFQGTMNLESVEIPGTIKEIGDYAFCNSGLKDITLKKGVDIIGEGSFYGLSGVLEEVFIPSTVDKIGVQAFNNNLYFKKITVEGLNDNYCDYNGALYSKNKSTLLCYPQGKMGFNNIDNNNYHPMDIEFYEGATKIGDYVFSGITGLYIVIP